MPVKQLLWDLDRDFQVTESDLGESVCRINPHHAPPLRVTSTEDVHKDKTPHTGTYCPFYAGLISALGIGAVASNAVPEGIQRRAISRKTVRLS